MATEINKLATTNLVRDARLRQESVPSRNLVNEQAVTNSSNSTNADNVVPLNAIERQNIAVSVSPTPDAGQSARSSNTQSEVSDAALSEISRAVQTIQRNLEFRVDDATGRTVITVKDSESQEVIRQIPSDQLLELSARLQEIESQKQSNTQIDAQGVLFTGKT